MGATPPVRAPEDGHELKRELRLGDLVLLQVLIIMGLPWTGVAARQGPTQVTFWLLGISTFYFPLAYTVIYLSRLMPLEGGLYQWAKLGLSPIAGYIAAWNFSFFLIIVNAGLGVTVANGFAYAFGPKATSVMSASGTVLLIQLLVFGAIYFANVIGLRLGKWITGTGGALMIGIYLLLALLLFGGLLHGKARFSQAFSVRSPGLSLLQINLFSKIAFAALGGFDQVAVFAGESREPGRNIARSVWIAGPLVALLYIVGTGSLLVYTKPENIDLVGPIPQILRAALSSQSAALFAAVVISALMWTQAAATLACVAEVARLPMVAGWDGLLPSWFSRLSPRYRTPSNAILCVTALCVAFGMASFAGAKEQEAYQLLLSAGNACAALYYLILFAIPVVGLTSFSPAPARLRVVAVAGFTVTLLFLGFSVWPIIDVKQPLIFALKVGLTVVAVNALGLWFYQRSSNRKGESQPAFA